MMIRRDSPVVLVASTDEAIPFLRDVARRKGWRFLPQATYAALRRELEGASAQALLFWLEPTDRAHVILELISLARSRWPGAIRVAATAVADLRWEREARAAGASYFLLVTPQRPLGAQLDAAVSRSIGASVPPACVQRPEKGERGPPQRAPTRHPARDRPL